MNKAILLLAVCVTSHAWGASDPFVGKWKVNPSHSKIYDEMKIEAAGTNRFAMAFGPGQVETVVADGSDQPALGGTTLSLSGKGINKWEVVRKLQGRILIRAQWTLSEDGKSLHDNFTQYLPNGTALFSQPLPDGSALVLPYVYTRSAGDSGLSGTWDSESATVRPGIELQIGASESAVLSFKRSDEGAVAAFRFDGSEHSNPGAAGPGPAGSDGGAAYVARRVNEQSLEIVNRASGQTVGTRQVELSSDRKPLTITDRLVGQSRPKSVLLFDRE